MTSARQEGGLTRGKNKKEKRRDREKNTSTREGKVAREGRKTVEGQLRKKKDQHGGERAGLSGKKRGGMHERELYLKKSRRKPGGRKRGEGKASGEHGGENMESAHSRSSEKKGRTILRGGDRRQGRGGDGDFRQ